MSGAGFTLGGWMAHAAVVGLLLAAAAWCLDRVLSRTRLPTRWVWVAALALTAVVPASSLIVHRGEAVLGARAGSFAAAGAVEWLVQPVTGTVAARGPAVAWPVALLEGGRSGIMAGLDAVAGIVPSDPASETVILTLWAAGSLALLVLLLRSRIAVAGRRRCWVSTELRGRAVRIAPDLGPAVVGFVRPEIVVPRWARSLDPTELDLVLAHEEEHIRARDPLLLHVALVPLCLFPWNPALWWQLRRLRDAVEVDCDRRLLGRGAAPARYGRLLLRLGTRGQADILPAPALSASPSLLERRLNAMKKRSLKTTLPLGLLAGFAAMGLLVLACEADTPMSGGPGEEAPEPADVRLEPADANEMPVGIDATELAREPVFTPYERAPEVRNASEVQRALQEEYSGHLRDHGIGGTVIVHFFIDETGSVGEAVVAEASGHPDLDEAAVRVARTFEFVPARNGGEPVPVWVQIPITFQTR